MVAVGTFASVEGRGQVINMIMSIFNISLFKVLTFLIAKTATPINTITRTTATRDVADEKTYS